MRENLTTTAGFDEVRIVTAAPGGRDHEKDHAANTGLHGCAWRLLVPGYGVARQHHEYYQGRRAA